MASYGKLADLSYTKAAATINEQTRGPGEVRTVPARPSATAWFCVPCWRWHGAPACPGGT